MSDESSAPFDPPFTPAQAPQHGLTDADLHGRRFTRVFTGVRRQPGARRHRHAGMAALTVCPEGSHASHFTAADISDLCPPEHRLTHVSVPVEAEGTRRRGIKSHEMASRSDVVKRSGVAVST